MKFFIYILLIVGFSCTAFAQNVGINTTTPNPQAALDVESTDKGVLLPRLTTAQRTTLGSSLGLTHESLLVFDKDDAQFYFWDGTTWSILDQTGTDDQGLNAALTGNMLQIDIEDGVSAMVDLTALKDDADNDPTNEIELPMTAMPGQVLTWDGMAWIAQDAGPGADGWGTDVVNTAGTNISGDGTVANPIEMTEVDGDTTNEIQDITLTGTELTISDGSTVDLAPIAGAGSSGTANTTPIVGSSGVKIVKLQEPSAQNDVLGMAYIGADDNIWTHGYGSFYVWGVPGRNTDALKPVVQPINPVNGEKIGKWKHVFATRTTLWALTDEGEVFRRGYAYNGQLGNGSTSAHLPFLTKMTFFETNNLKVKYLCMPPGNVFNSSGSNVGHSVFAITEDGDVYSWGRNNYGQLGIGNTVQQLTPVKITGLDFQFVHKMAQSGSSSGVSVAALDTLNSVYIWGYNGYGQLGLGNTSNYSAPALVTGVTAKEILMTKLSWGTTMIINPNGEVKSAGYNVYGIIGDGTTTNKNVFTPTMTPFTNARSIHMDVANYVGAIVTDDGYLYVAGDNPDYGLGVGTTSGKYSDYIMPAGPFQGMVDKVHIGGWGSYKSLHLIDTLGRIWSCGENRSGQLGQGGTHDPDPDGLFSRAIDELSGAVKFVDIRAIGHFRYDYFSTVVLTEDGRVMIAGAPQYGKTGQGDNSYFRRYFELINFN